MKAKIPFFATILCLVSVYAMAQGGPAPPPALNEVPLDGFSALLLAVGAGYGAKKALDKKSPKPEQ
jgi:hypothetical protein